MLQSGLQSESTFACKFGALRRGICKSKKSSKFGDPQEPGLYQICKIPLLSAPNGTIISCSCITGIRKPVLSFFPGDKICNCIKIPGLLRICNPQ
jgi:hypothetical protein